MFNLERLNLPFFPQNVTQRAIYHIECKKYYGPHLGEGTVGELDLNLEVTT